MAWRRWGSVRRCLNAVWSVELAFSFGVWRTSGGVFLVPLSLLLLRISVRLIMALRLRVEAIVTLLISILCSLLRRLRRSLSGRRETCLFSIGGMCSVPSFFWLICFSFRLVDQFDWGVKSAKRSVLALLCSRILPFCLDHLCFIFKFHHIIPSSWKHPEVFLVPDFLCIIEVSDLSDSVTICIHCDCGFLQL